MKIRTSMFLGFGFIIAILLGVLSMVYINMNNMANIVENLYSYSMRTNNAAVSLKANIKEMQYIGKSMFLERNPRMLIDMRENIFLFDQIVEQNLQTIEETATGDVNITRDVRESFNSWREVRNEIMELLIDGDVDGADIVVRIQETRQLRQLDQTLNYIVQFAEQDSQEQYERSKITQLNAIRNVVLMFLLAVVIILVIIFALSYKITKPLAIIVSAMKDISDGKGDLTRTIDINTKDEIGELANYFNKFICELKGIIAGIQDTVNIVNAKTADISWAIDLVIHGKSDKKSDSKELVVIKGITELKENVKKEQNGVKNLSMSTSQTLSALEEISATTEQTKSNLDRILDGSRKATEISNVGSRNIGEMTQEISNINDKVANTEKQIIKVIEFSRNIEDITVSINALAEQTNLLALNAAIEAARAGDAGRGFSVVADEIRKLAEKTNGETTKIEDILVSIQKEFKEVKFANSEVEKHVNFALEKSENVKKTIQETIELIGRNDTEINNIATSIKEQSSSTNEITNEMSIINSTTNEIEEYSIENINIVESVSEVLGKEAENLVELTDKTEELQQSIGGFEIEEKCDITNVTSVKKGSKIGILKNVKNKMKKKVKKLPKKG